MRPSAIPAFTETHAALLQTYLSSPQRPMGTMTYPQLAGFLFSMANAPELIPPSEWIPMVFNDQEGGPQTLGEAERVLQAMMALYNECGLAGPEGRAPLPPGCEIRPQAMDNLVEAAPLSQWARGRDTPTLTTSGTTIPPRNSMRN
jgi:yecA family protein